ncbi:MAG: S41 family peptidase [Bacteroidota bacterium]
MKYIFTSFSLNFSYKWLAILGLMVVVLWGCEEAFLDPPTTDPESIFDEAWNFADQEYSFFEFKNIDWDQQYSTYRPQVTSSTSEEALFEILADMLFVLRDGHVNLRSNFDRSRNWEWYLNSPENFDYSLLERNYFNQEEQFVGPFVYRDFGDVGYMYYGSFSSLVESEDMDFILNKVQDKRGLIIDVRNNGGGATSNVNRIAGHFVAEDRTVGIFRRRNGPNRNDFGDLFGITLTSQRDDPYTKPVFVLTNRRCYSATNRFVMTMGALPQVTVLGDTTGGGGGTPSFTELANGWQMRVSNTQSFILLTDSTNNEQVAFNIEDGIPPAIRVDLSPTDEARGTDTILEAALRRLRE